MIKRIVLSLFTVACMASPAARAQIAPDAPAPAVAYDAELVRSLGGNDNGMRSWRYGN